MPLSDAMKMQFEECFVIKAQKAVEIEMPALAEIMRSMGQNPTTDEVKALFDKVAGGESSINSAKMLTAVAEFQDVMTAKDQLTELADAFAVFDKDKSGSISGAELRHVISNLGEPVDEDELEQMMAEADKDGNGTINYKEFVNVMFNAVTLPPPVIVSEELKPYWDALVAKEAGGKKEKE